MSGGSWERVSAYVNNADSNLINYGANILNANSKYKNIYTVGTTDTSANNYTTNHNIFGDAVYEISTGSTDSTSWYGDYSYMPNTTTPWFARGGNYGYCSYAGTFTFYYTNGTVTSSYSFRPVVRATA